MLARLDISIHTPREGSDFNPHKGGIFYGDFNPHSPRGERHNRAAGGPPEEKISIHTPREGSDDISALNIELDGLFQSTLPARGAT